MRLCWGQLGAMVLRGVHGQAERVGASSGGARGLGPNGNKGADYVVEVVLGMEMVEVTGLRVRGSG